MNASAEGEPPNQTSSPAVTAKRRYTALERFDRLRRRGRQYSTGEEVGNAVSHGVGACLAIAALVLLIVFSVKAGGGLKLLSLIHIWSSSLSRRCAV